MVKRLLVFLVVFGAVFAACALPEAEAKRKPPATTTTQPPVTTTQPPVTTTVAPTTTTVAPTTTTAPPTTTTTQPPVQGSRWFTASSLWNTPYPASATFHDKPALRSSYWYLNSESYGIPVFKASGSDPVITVHAPATWGWPAATLTLRAPSSIGPAAGSDANLALIDADGHTAYDFWQWRWNNTQHTDATVSAWAKTDIVSNDGFGQSSPWQAEGIRGAGSSTLAGLVVGNELTTGINHALAIAGPSGTFCAEAGPNGYIPPAINGDGACEGPRLGIPRNVAMPAGLSVQGQNLFRALQTYGGFASDTSGCCASGTVYADPLSVPVADVNAARSALTVIDDYVRMID